MPQCLDQITHLLLIHRFLIQFSAENSLARVQLLHIAVKARDSLLKVLPLLDKLVCFASAYLGGPNQIVGLLLHLLVLVQQLTSLLLNLVRPRLELLEHALHSLSLLTLLL